MITWISWIFLHLFLRYLIHDLWIVQRSNYWLVNGSDLLWNFGVINITKNNKGPFQTRVVCVSKCGVLCALWYPIKKFSLILVKFTPFAPPPLSVTSIWVSSFPHLFHLQEHWNDYTQSSFDDNIFSNQYLCQITIMTFVFSVRRVIE